MLKKPILETSKKVVLVTNAPAPYRIPALKLLAKYSDISLKVIYCTRLHADNTLDMDENGFETYYLTKPYHAYKRRFMHADIGITKLLRAIRPDVVITNGYIPTFLYAFVWAWWHRVPHIVMTDGTLKSERSYSRVHKLIRRIVFSKSASFIGASQGSLDLFKSYGIPEEKLFKAPLAINNQRFLNQKSTYDKVDFIFCGRLIQHKGPLFALEVAAEVSKRLGRVISIDFVGSGDQETKLKERAKELLNHVSARFHGYATQVALPSYYKGAKIFLFPTEWDPWGVVGNEACAAGLPVIVSPNAGIANELVFDGENGYIRDLDLKKWAAVAVDLLSNHDKCRRMGDRSIEIVQNFSFKSAAKGMHSAILKAFDKQDNMVEIKQIVIVSLMRPSGTTGVQTHVNTFTAYLDSISQPWQLVTPFSAPKFLLYPLLTLRRIIEPVFPAAAVWLYRKGHAWLLGIVLKRVLRLNPNEVIYAQCPVSAKIALDKRQSTSQQVTLVVHFNISQAEEWAGKGMIAQHGSIYHWITDFEQRVIPRVDKLVFVSVYMQQQIQKRIPAIANITQQVIPNFVADPIPQNQVGIDADLIAIGTLEPRKNQAYLLDIIAAAKALGERITLTLVGDGPDRAMLENKAKKLGISDQIYFKGFIPNGSSLMARHQACIHVAKVESFGIVLIEAMSYQLPVFAPAVGGMSEILEDAVNGCVIPIDSAIEAATIVISVLENKSLVTKLGRTARNYFLNNYDQKIVGNQLCKFIITPVKVDFLMGSLSQINKKEFKNRKVVIIQRCLMSYRVPFFEKLKKLLEQDSVELRLLYGEATLREKTKNDTVDIAWGEKLVTRYLWGNRICWQPFFSKVRDADLVIVTQENKLICNLWPLFGWRRYKLAFWGHGKNMQALSTLFGKLKESMKFLTTNRVDWWFAYSGVSQRFVSQLGFSEEKITNVENSVDTLELNVLSEAITSAEIKMLRSALDLGNGPVGLFVGSLYKDKHLEFLLHAGHLISQKIPDFRLVIIGDGPQSSLIINAQLEFQWLRYVGRQVGRNKAQYLKMASVLLNPGLVGLSILDGFAAGIPIVTTDCGLHSPEIDYLRQGENGFMTVNKLEDYVQTVVRILTDTTLASHLQKGCLKAVSHYTIENMAENFRFGILKALG